VGVTSGKELKGAELTDMSVTDDTRARQRGEDVTIENTERLLTPHQVAVMFRVDPKTVTRWASSGRIGFIRTPGGHRRFRETEIRALLTERAVPAASSTA